MASHDRLYGIARVVLDTVAAGLATAGHDVPARQYVADGNMVAWDCEQLVVAVDTTQNHQGNVAVEATDLAFAMAARSATLGVWIARCCPTVDDDGSPPPADEVDASAQVVLADPMIMLDCLWRAHAAGDLGSCKGLAFQRWQAIGPMGGLTGGVLRLNIDLTAV